MQTLSHKQRAIVLTQLGVKNVKGLNKLRLKYCTPNPPQPKPDKPKANDRRAVEVRCTTTGEVFPSLAAAAKAHFTQASSISAHLHGKLHTVNGRQYERVPTGKQRRKSARGTAVHCITTGEYFANTTEAAKAHGVRMGHLSEHLGGLGQTVKGKKYEYV